MPRIILARHGQTEFNKADIVMGRSDSPLTVQGIGTVWQLARTLEREGVRALFCSSLGRAVASARIYAEILGLEQQIRPALAELSCGEWEGQSRVPVAGEGRMRKTWLDRVPGGESYKDAEGRVGSLISEVRSDNRPGTVLLVGHAGVNRVFLKLWLDLDPELALRIHFPHELAYIIEEDSTVLARRSTGRESDGLIFDPE